MTFSNSIPNLAPFIKEVFDLMFILESDEMPTLLPTETLTFTFYTRFSNSIPNWITIVKEIFSINA